MSALKVAHHVYVGPPGPNGRCRTCNYLEADPVHDVLSFAASNNGSPVRAEQPALLRPLDWPALIRDGLPEIESLRDPYLKRAARVLAVGPASSAKSLWAAHEGAALSREGRRVVLIDQENPLPEALRRLDRLRPDAERFEVYHFQGIDLSDPDHVAEVLDVCRSADLAIVDTLSACWRGDENDNAQFALFDQEVMQPIIGQGTTFLLIDHTGHPSPLVRRRGVSAPRGASSKAQKVDVVLEFRPVGGGFVIEHAKARLGGVLEPPATFSIVDHTDGSIKIVRGDDEHADSFEDARERLVALVAAKPGHYTKSKLAELSDLRKQDALTVVGKLIAEGTLGPDKARAHLSVLGEGSESSEGTLL